MRLISYRLNDEPGVGVMTDATHFVPLATAAPQLPRTLRSILESGDGWQQTIAKAVAGKASNLSLDDVELDPVIPESNAVWALALNYVGHQKEINLKTSALYPQVFLRHPASQTGHDQPILCPHPSVARAFDYEAELAVIIGKPGRNIPKERAMEHVAGYACYNEGTIREYQGHNRQFGLGKNFEQTAGFGPWMMTPDEFKNPYQQMLVCRLNGIERQKICLGEMLFKIEDIIHYLSQGYRLRPGDVIATGTCEQMTPTPPEFADRPNLHPLKKEGTVHMMPGDVCEVEITGLGVLRNPVAAEPAGADYSPD
jgi:2-keto-4-pentenoate hydratase/2-oxohepta-3-ene-1,7-dioic acid hydratase in catechol pathway